MDSPDEHKWHRYSALPRFDGLSLLFESSSGTLLLVCSVLRLATRLDGLDVGVVSPSSSSMTCVAAEGSSWSAITSAGGNVNVSGTCPALTSTPCER